MTDGEGGMRILVAHNVSRSRTGGMSRIMAFTHDQLEAAGHTVDYFCSEDLPSRWSGRARRYLFPLAVWRHAVRKASEGEPYDVVNVHEPASAPIARWRRSAGDPGVVVTTHGVERRSWELALEELKLGREGPSRRSRLLHPLTTLWQASVGLHGADHIFCLNEEDRSYLMDWLDVPASYLTRIFPAASPLYAEAAEGRDYERARRILFAATWRKNKGIEDLIPAFTRMARRRPELELIVLGGGLSEESIRGQFEPAVRDQVSCVTTDNEEATAREFARTDIFLLPSLFEGTPLTLLEAMTSGLPVVTTATCGMKDVIRDGENGLLVPIRSPGAIESAVERLLEDSSLRERLGRAAQQDGLTRYTWETSSEPIESAYRRLTEQPRNTPLEGKAKS